MKISINKIMEVTYEDNEYEDDCHSCGKFEEYEIGDGIDIITKDGHEVTGDIIGIEDGFVTVKDCDTDKNVVIIFDTIKSVDTY